MKKFLVKLMAVVTAVAVTACAGGGDTDDKDKTTTQPATKTEQSKEPSKDATEPVTDDATESATETPSEDGTESEQPTGETHKIGVLAPAVTHGWVAGVTYHAEKRLNELSDRVESKVYTSNNAEEMTAQLDDLKTWGAEAIVAFPQWEGMESPIQEAIDEGIKVVNFDIEIDADGVYRVSGDNRGMGEKSAEYIVDKIGTEGTVIILDVPSSGSVAELRKAGFLDVVKEIAPDLELHEYATQFTREAGLADMSDILTKHDHIDAVFSMDDETSIGALQAMEEADRTEIKVITGGGGAQEYFHMMPEHEDIWLQSALYSPVMVEDAVDMALDILDGKDVEPVVIIPTEIVDRSNVEQYFDDSSPY